MFEEDKFMPTQTPIKMHTPPKYENERGDINIKAQKLLKKYLKEQKT